MDTISFWEGTAPDVRFPSLTGDAEADVVVVGGGITGITTAHQLARAGARVIVLEAGRVGSGTTGYSTGNLYATVDEGLYKIRERWGQETAAAVVRSRREAIDAIEAIVTEYGLACGFTRRGHYLYPTNRAQTREMHQEYGAVTAAGLSAAITDQTPLPFPVRQALRIDHQAQFHPSAYVKLLAQAIASPECQIYENSRAIEIDRDQRIVNTASGTVRGHKLVLATHTPKGVSLVQTELAPYREYGIAARLTDDAYPEGIFWSLEQPGHSIRSASVDGARHLIVIGEKHKVGQHKDGVDYYANVERFARSRFNIASFAYRWSAQNYQPADLLPYIGLAGGSDAVYVATGFGANGLVYGTLAGMILAEELQGRLHPWRDLYSARRFTPAKSAPSFVRENVNIAQQYLRDYLTRADVSPIEDIGPGEGKLIAVDGRKLAAYRDEHDNWTVLSPVCPHLGCLVHWNALEKTWDCPCHGSRFAATGEVLEGPALRDLAARRVGTDEPVSEPDSQV
jgi:glycine/D-amino acid oxidase-like deaminating enzyme/nitrite reductase/ring-hydroxylating ferredoxin subunit